MEQKEIKRIFGDITDHKAAEIASSGLPVVELEKIAFLLAGDTDHGIEMGHLSPRAQDLLALLRRDDESWEDQP
ncbi:MAG: hypothetical protein QNJ20_11985 [Paracoccaceae bacterium]|nr:hypothetical protein [Paracoccaceae bacterium]